MDELKEENEKLRKEIADLEKNLSMAAHYGKELLDQNGELHTKLEENIKQNGKKLEKYEQDIYSQSLSVSAKQKTIYSLQSELENLEAQHKKSLIDSATAYELKISYLNKQLAEKKGDIENLESEVSIQVEQIKEMEALLEESKLQRNQSIVCDETLNDSYSHQNQIIALTNEKQNLEADLMKFKSLCKSSQLEINKHTKALELRAQELEEKECKITSLYNINEKVKENIVELQMEIDTLKMCQTDPRKKGNSLFAEVEDNRQLLEKNVLTLKTNNSVLLQQNDIKTQQIAKMKLQIASLLSLNTSSESDLEYQKGLEDSLASAKTQLVEFSKRCKELEAQLASSGHSMDNVGAIEGSQMEVRSVYKDLYEEARAKVAALEVELNSFRFNKVSLDDQLVQLKRKLYRTEQEKDATHSKLIKTRVELEEMILDKGLKKEEKQVKLREVTEKLNFKIEVNSEEVLSVKDQNPSNTNLIEVLDSVQKVEGKENKAVKKVKKSVKMAEEVAFKEADSNEERKDKLRDKTPKKLVPKKNPRRVMEAPIAKQLSEEHGECKQQ